MTKVHARIIATEMRKNGHSYNHIAKILGISKSTVGIWVENIPYVPNAETIERIGKARAASGAAKNVIFQESFRQARQEAMQDIPDLSKQDLFMLGLGLYIGEGSKSSSATCFVNSNMSIINTIIRWFAEALDMDRAHIRMRLHLYPDSDIEKCHQFWSEGTGIARTQFFRPVIDMRQNKRVLKAGKLPYGTAHLTIHSLGNKRFGVFLARKILAWSDRVLDTKNAGLV